MIVVDASAVIELLLNTEAGRRVGQRLFTQNESLHAPHLIDLEVAQVVRRYTLGREMTSRRGREVLQDLANLPLTRYPHEPFLFRIWALRDNLTAYDAAYVSLAEVMGAPLLTRDAALAAIQKGRVKVELI